MECRVSFREYVVILGKGFGEGFSGAAQTECSPLRVVPLPASVGAGIHQPRLAIMPNVFPSDFRRDVAFVLGVWKRAHGRFVGLWEGEGCVK